MLWIGNCDVTSIEIWRHCLYTIYYEGLNYTIWDKITPPWKFIGETPEIQIGCYRGDSGQQRHSGQRYVFMVIPQARHTIYTDWIRGASSSSFRGGGNFHELSFDDVIVLIQLWYNFSQTVTDMFFSQHIRKWELISFNQACNKGGEAY